MNWNMRSAIGAAVMGVVAACSAVAQPVQWRVEDGGNGHWYEVQVRPSSASWHDAKVYAESIGGHLATLNSASENAFVASLQPGQFLLGGYQDLQAPDYSEPNGGWRWVTGEPWQFTAWNPGEPNNGSWPDGARGENVLNWWRFEGSAWNPQWNDAGRADDCCYNQPAGIEWEADCNGDGIVDKGQILSGQLSDVNGNGVPDSCEVPTAAVQWRVEDGGNGHWYQLIRSASSFGWHQAQQQAVSLGGHLAVLTSQAENDWVRDHVVAPRDPHNGEDGPFIGAHCEGRAFGDWVWVNNEPFEYVAWSNGEPASGGSERFVNFWRWSGLWWNDITEDGGGHIYTAVVEWSSDCNGDGFVDKGQILSGQLVDVNGNGVPDSCEVPAAAVEWTQRAAVGPAPRLSHAMAYDSARGVTVLFGGDSPNGVYNGDTWEWDGTAWTQRVVSGPSPRDYHAMVYDSLRGVTVLFGGERMSPRYDDTWEWNGTVWTQRAVSGPSPRGGHAMAYDAARGVTVLFGGNSGAPGFFNETWEYNGTTWTQRAVTGPQGRSNFTMAYDAARGVTVLFGGTNSGAGTGAGVLGDTWEWNGNTWSQRAVNGPAAREYLSMVYDSTRHVTILFGGFAQALNGETWEWDGTVWTQRVVSGPSARMRHAMVYDATRSRTVLFGGITSGNAFSGETWELRAPCTAPAITMHPTEALLLPGQFAQFDISATNATSYQWRRDSVNLSNSARISGVDAPSLVILNVQSNDQGFYDCIVTSGCGAAMSDRAELSCKGVVIQQPSGGEIVTGETLQLSAVMSVGGATTYRWKKDGVSLFNGALYSGAFTPSLTIHGIDPTQSGNYTLTITNPCGAVVTEAATVVVRCVADFNRDGEVNPDDLADFVGSYFAAPPSERSDFNGDGEINPDDLADFIGVYFAGGC